MNTRLVMLAAGRRIVWQSIGLILATIALNVAARMTKSPAVGFIAELCGLIALCFAIVAVFRVGEGLGYGMVARVGLAMLAVLPAVNLVMLFVLQARAARALDGKRVTGR